MKETTGNKHCKEKYPHFSLTDRIIKCAIEVHKVLGPGFVESVYEKALIYEMKENGLKVEEQVAIPVVYKGKNVGEHKLDLLVEDTVIVEIKTVKGFDEIHRAQVLSYLKATDKRIGLLINFAKTKIEVKRIVL